MVFHWGIVIRDHIGWNTSKIISWLISLLSNLWRKREKVYEYRTIITADRTNGRTYATVLCLSVRPSVRL